MKKRLLAILTASTLVLGVAGVTFISTGQITPQQTELPNLY
jgi:hypothetical protein